MAGLSGPSASLYHVWGRIPMSTSDNLEELSSRSSRITPLEAMTMALEGAMARGRGGDPRVILDCLPDRWGLVDADDTASRMAELYVGPWEELAPNAIVPEQRSEYRCDHTRCLMYGTTHLGTCVEGDSA